MTSNFEGRSIDATDIKLRGAAGSDQLNPLLHLDDEVLIVGRARINRVQHHEHDKRGLIRTQTAEVIEAHIVDTEDDAFVDVETMLMNARADREAALDNLLGRAPLPFDPQTGEAIAETVKVEEVAPTPEPTEPAPSASEDYTEILQREIAKPIPKKD